MKCFLSCSFRDEDESVMTWFRDFLDAFPDVEVIEARDRPEPPREQVQQCLADSHFVCAIVTRRGEGIPAWILDEVGMAHAQNKTIAAFVEHGIPMSALGILPSITEFKTFQRDSLGSRSPEYLRYIYNARVAVLKQMSLDRATLLRRIEIIEADRYRLDDN